MNAKDNGISKEKSEVIMVDDSKQDTAIAYRCYQQSKLKAPWREFLSGKDFLDYLELVKNKKAPMPHLVFLDINMPEMSGFEVLEKVKANPYFKNMPVFMMLTSSSHENDKSKSMEYGANGFYTKPSSIQEYVTLFNSFVEKIKTNQAA